MDELLGRVTNGLENCIKAIDGPICPRECQYFDACRGNGNDNGYIYAPLLKDAQALILEQKKRIEAIEKKYDALLKKHGALLKKHGALLDRHIAELTKQINDGREKLIRAGLWNEGSGNHGAGEAADLYGGNEGG